MKNKNHTRPAKPFFQKLLKDQEIRIQFEEEKLKTEIVYAVRTARMKADLTQQKNSSNAYSFSKIR